jgi:2-aminoethylphosphonate-pyruvate transaminase
MIRRAILPAASKGRQTNGHEVPAALTEVGGSTLIKRTLLALEQHGIHDVIVVIGYRGEEIRRHVSTDHDITARIVWVENPEWHLPDGNSLRRARPYIDEPTLVLGSELVFAPEMLGLVVDQDTFTGDATLFVDRKLSRVYDLGAAIKVQTASGRILRIGTDLTEFDAVATGLTVVSPELLDGLDPGNKETTLLALLQHASAEGRAFSMDVNGSQWQEITTPETRLHAEWLLRAYGDDLSGHAPVPAARLAAGDPGRTLSYIEGLLSEKRARHYVLFNPGPVLTSPRVKSALVHYDVCHRDSDYSQVLRRIQRKLRRVCRGGPEHDIVLLSGSGTAAMEATLSSCVPPDGKLLVVSNGAFGERFTEIAEVHKIPTRHLRYAWGQLMDPADVARILDEDPAIVACIMCHHETSVGLLNPIHEIGNLCRKRDKMFFVDAVSSLAGEDLDVRRDKIDVLISSANKCLHAISGVSFVCINNRIWPRIEQIPPRVYYLNLKRYHSFSRSVAQTPFTPAVSNFFALDAALDELLQEGTVHRIRHYRMINRRIRKAFRRMGLEQLTSTGHESHTITTLKVPEYIDFVDLYEEMKSRGYIIYNCKEHLENRYFQIANMGELSDEMIQGFLDSLALALKRGQQRLAPRAGAQPATEVQSSAMH